MVQQWLSRVSKPYPAPLSIVSPWTSTRSTSLRVDNWTEYVSFHSLPIFLPLSSSLLHALPPPPIAHMWLCSRGVRSNQRIWDLETPASFTAGVDGGLTAAVPEDDLITAKALSAIDWPFGSRRQINGKCPICWFCQPPAFPTQRSVVADVPAVYKIYRVDSWPGSTIFW